MSSTTTTTRSPATRGHRPVDAPTSHAGALTAVTTVALRTVRTVLRSPQILGFAVIQSALFLIMFRYVLGGAIAVTGVSYVDYLIPGVVVSGLLFTAGGGAVAVAEEAVAGLYDRLRSLPVPDIAVLAGRALADAALLFTVAVITLGIGLVIGFRSSAGVGHWALALGLLALFATAVALVYVWVGLASRSAQAANGLGLLGVPLSFLSSAFIPVATMPDVVQAFAAWQPLTFFVNTWRGLLLGDPVTSSFAHSLSFYVVGSVAWSLALVAVSAPLALRAYRRD